MTQVLVVDDDFEDRSNLVENLTGRDYTMRAAGEAWAALREVAERAPHVIVLDPGLPDMRGRELLRLSAGRSAGNTLAGFGRAHCGRSRLP